MLDRKGIRVVDLTLCVIISSASKLAKNKILSNPFLGAFIEFLILPTDIRPYSDEQRAILVDARICYKGHSWPYGGHKLVASGSGLKWVSGGEGGV